MERAAYFEFRDQEDRHWWFLARRSIFGHLLRRRLQRGIRNGARAMDLGCGMGGMLDELGQGASFVVGTDMESEALAHCRTRGHRRLFRGLGQRLPLADASLDLITAFDTIEHIPDDEATLAECFRVLKPGGRIFVSVPAYQWLYSNQDRLVHHQRRYTAGGLARKLATAGFRVERVSYINFLLFPAILPLVLLFKLKQRLFPPPPDVYSTNVGVPVPPWANRLLAGIFAFERHLVGGCSAPAGHSLMAIARKPGRAAAPSGAGGG